jgi:hypothetical protein
MKMWIGHSSEHSMNLVMIGRFKKARSAEEAAKLIARLIDSVQAESEHYANPAELHRFTESMLKLLTDANLHSLGPQEIEQFQYDVHVDTKEKEIVLRTDEADVSAFLKVLLDKGARIEVYSAHDYPEEKADK